MKWQMSVWVRSSLIVFLLLTVAGCDVLLGPRKGELVQTWESTDSPFKIRINMHIERGGFMPALGGAYYVFQSAQLGSDEWREIMTFRHDDPNPIPADQVRFVNDKIAYVYMGWMYAVTTDSGISWNIWDGQKSLGNIKCCPYGFIQSVRMEPDGTGKMTLDSHAEPDTTKLTTRDFGQHWE